MSQWTIAKRLIAGFSAVILITLCLGGFAFSRLLQIDNDARRIVGDALPGVTAILQMAANTRENRALLLEHMAETSPAGRAAIESRITEHAEATDKTIKAYEATITLDEDRALFGRIVKEQKEFRTTIESELLPLSRAGKTEEARAVFKTRVAPELQDYMTAIEAAVKFNHDNGVNWGNDLSEAVSQSKTGIVVGFLLALSVGFGVAWLIISTTNRALRSSVEELTEGAHQVASASSQVSTSAQTLSQGATEQAASLEETSASMEEMASMTRQNAENSATAASLMGEVDTRVRESNQSLSELVTSMGSIQESSKRVAKIIKTIDEIAFQTNILALNAAVEAARAGEAGAGFAVVADEVRNLAQRSAQAARDTTNLIEASVVSAESGNQRVEQVAASITGITASVSKVKGLVEEVSAASRQQSQGIDQVSQAVAQMEKVTQATAATAEESAAASEELSAQAETSLGVVGRLELLVGGGQVAAATPARRHAAGRGSRGRVVAMPAPKRPAMVKPSNDERIPMGDTGTFGSF